MKKNNVNKKLNIKSEKGFTMQDLIGAVIIFVMFMGVISAMMNVVYKLNLKIRMTAYATNYAIAILEDIDKISYDNVQNSLASSYKEKFKIPDGFNVNLEIEEITNTKLISGKIKKVKLRISYSLQNETEDLFIEKYKVKEI